MCKVSVIIPVYNTENYLERCLNSIIAQSLKDIEIICIDDCSTDSSRTIIKEYAKKDSRITILYNEKNYGLSFTRNRGIRAASGKYIQFVDSDDYVMDFDCLKYMYTLSEKQGLDFLKYRFGVSSEKKVRNIIEYKDDVDGIKYNGIILFEKLTMDKTLDVSACTYLLKKEFIETNNIMFYEGIYFEDFLFTYKLLTRAKACMCVNNTGYMYVVNPTSITRAEKSEKHIYGLLVVINEILKEKNKMYETRYASLAYIFRIQKKIMGYIYQIGQNIVQPYWEEDIVDLYYNIISFNVDVEFIDKNYIEIMRAPLVYIFGAGEMATELFQVINKKNIQINGVLVSDASKNSQTIMGHKIIPVDDVLKNKETAVVLVAVTGFYKQEVIELLQKKGFKNILYIGK